MVSPRPRGPAPSQQRTQPHPFQAPQATAPGAMNAPQPMGMGGGGFLRGMAGGLVGGMIGSMLFRNSGWGGGGEMGMGRPAGGIGLIEILLLAGIAFFIFRWFKQRSETQYYSEGYTSGGATAPPMDTPTPYADDVSVASIVGQGNPNFNLDTFKEARVDDFFKLQAALMSRDLTSVREKVTPQILAILENDIVTLKEAGKINRIENIAVREADINEAWQEDGADYATLRLKASLLDYSVDDKTGAVLGGSNTVPIKFDEYWTFVRAQSDWKLTAIEAGDGTTV